VIKRSGKQKEVESKHNYSISKESNWRFPMDPNSVPVKYIYRTGKKWKKW
jgi:hypothetical protein